MGGPARIAAAAARARVGGGRGGQGQREKKGGPPHGSSMGPDPSPVNRQRCYNHADGEMARLAPPGRRLRPAPPRRPRQDAQARAQGRGGADRAPPRGRPRGPEARLRAGDEALHRGELHRGQEGLHRGRAPGAGHRARPEGADEPQEGRPDAPEPAGDRGEVIPEALRSRLPVPVPAPVQRLGSTAVEVYVFFSSMSFRYKIAGALLATLCLAIGSLGLVTFSQQKRVLQGEMSKRAEVLALQLAGAGKTALLTKDELAVASVIRELQKMPEMSYAHVLDKDGKVFASSSLEAKNKLLSGASDLAAAGTKALFFQETAVGGDPVLEAAVPIVSRLDGREIRVGTARLGLSRKELVAAVRRQKGIFVAVTAGYILLGLGISFALGNVLSRQIVILVTAMKVVSEGDLDHTAAVESFDDVGRMAESFNDMILKLREKLHMERYLSQGTLALISKMRGGEKMRLGGERRRVTVLFSDIRGFTAMTEVLDAEEIVGLLNLYLNLQAEVVTQHGGTVDKFVGDELMAIFDGDGAEASAARASVEIHGFIDSLNAAREKAGRRLVRIGIGLNAGEVIMGNMGSEQRMDYTVIGDPVNVAARLCGAAQPGQVIMSRAVREALGEDCACQALAPLPVKGKKEPLEVFTLLGMKNAQRRHRRKPVKLPATFSLAGLTDEPQPATVRDLSRSGCVLEVRQPLGAGSQLQLSVEEPALDRLSRWPVVVRHLRKAGGGYLVGVMFADLDDETAGQVSEFVHKVDTVVAARPEPAEPPATLVEGPAEP
ncbi:HAMP domain-containing protein [bacterium]|nr:MAG: HAMP domain-containing protein [bacterium]